MRSQATRELVKAVFSDAGTRQQFLADPGSVIARFNITGAEREALLSTYHRVGLVTGNSPQLGAAIVPLIFWF